MPVPDDRPALCVLASGSAGNCSVLRLPGGRCCLIDAGLSVRRTLRLLRRFDLSIDDVDDLVLTHLDHDHYAERWARVLPARVTVRVHESHIGRAARSGLLPLRTEPFGTRADLACGARLAACIAPHDSLGVSVLRFECAGGSLGFATDIGRVTEQVVAHLRAVDLLAIESNYCPRMQEESARPPLLKRRIMGGSGHLSNHQSADAVRRIAPRAGVVLLHLSRQCNRPELAADAHRASPPVAISSHDEPTGWISVAGAPCAAGAP